LVKKELEIEEEGVEGKENGRNGRRRIMRRS
jgi:hypothetical protein